MAGTIQTCLSSLFKFTTEFLHQINAFKAKNSKRPISNWNSLTSSFTSMEFTNQLQQVFKFFDGNGDGKISPAELRQALVNLGHDKSTAGKEAEKMVREMDSDGDGFIDLDEFMKVMDSVEEGDNLVDAFSVFDCDKNGLISPQELKRVLVRLGSSNCSLRECKKMIKGVDKDGDGFISFQEFKLMMGVEERGWSSGRQLPPLS